MMRGTEICEVKLRFESDEDEAWTMEIARDVVVWSEDDAKYGAGYVGVRQACTKMRKSVEGTDHGECVDEM